MAKCPKCNKDTLTFNKEWDKEFDRLESNIPSGDLIHSALANRGIHKYECSNCGHATRE